MPAAQRGVALNEGIGTRNTAMPATQNTGHGEVILDGLPGNVFGIESGEDITV